MHRLYMRGSIVLLLVAAFAGQAQAQGSISWDSAYPKPGTTSGTIDVYGTMSLDSCWGLADNVFTVRVWQDDEVLFTFSGSPAGSTWSLTASGLTSDVTYNVTAEVTVTNGSETVTLVTAPKTAKAK